MCCGGSEGFCTLFFIFIVHTLEQGSPIVCRGHQVALEHNMMCPSACFKIFLRLFQKSMDQNIP